MEPVVDAADIEELKNLISRHLQYTDSTVARDILDDWDTSLAQFVKVMPIDYKRVLLERAKRQEKQALAV